MGGGAQILEMEQWVNGNKAWVRQPMQPMQELSGDDLAKALESEQFNALLRWKELGFEPTVTEKKEMNGSVVYVLNMKKKHSTEEMFIDAEDFRMVAKSETNDTPQGPVATMTTYGDYRPVDGLMLPHSLHIEGAGMTQKATVTSYKQNVPIDDSEFSVKN
jgi:outer membrane lipoprotein-sorting protein